MRTDLQPHHHDEEVANSLIPHDDDRDNFRLLARALGGECEIGAEEWRKSRCSAPSAMSRRVLGSCWGRRRSAILITMRIHLTL